MTVGMLMQMLASYPCDKEVYIGLPHGNTENIEWNCVPAERVGSGNYNRLVIGSDAMSNKFYRKLCLSHLREENEARKQELLAHT